MKKKAEDKIYGVVQDSDWDKEKWRSEEGNSERFEWLNFLCARH